MKIKESTLIQLFWGIILICTGIGVFYRIPQVMPKIADLETFGSIIPFIQFCFYLIGIILLGGGVKKVYTNVEMIKKERSKD